MAVAAAPGPRLLDSLQEKYSRQMLFAGIGEEGQQRLLASSAVVVGCGAIGAAAAGLLVRAGVGRVRIIDRDFVEPSNLQRQTLFDEEDASNALPKAIAAERKLRAINGGVAVEGLVSDLNPNNAEELLTGFDLILDGTDNFETRFLINDFAVQSATPWIYAAAVASYGVTMTIRPGLTPCLACLLESSSNGHGLEETCDTVGVLGPIVNLIASLEVSRSAQAPRRPRTCSSWSPYLLRCLDRALPVRPRRPKPGLPCLRSPRFLLPPRTSPAAHHPMRPGFRTDSRTWPYP